MPSIDERIVAMSFENAKFEAAVAKTQATLQKLDQSLKTIGATTGLSNIEAAANKVTFANLGKNLDGIRSKLSFGTNAAQSFSDVERASQKVTLEAPSTAVDKLQSKLGGLSSGTTFTDIEKASDQVTMSGMQKAISGIQNQFSLLEGAAAVALGNIATKATMAGGNFAKGFAFGPIKQGFEEYTTNLNSIQTILANTEASGATLDDVNKHLQELNTYSDQTIYNFSQMAKNIGTFTAAGVDLDKSTQSIKGIANLAALSGSNSEQAAHAMQQLSQAIASGKVGLQDWNSVVNAGMGGTTFQRALTTTAQQMGSLKDHTVALKGPMKNVSIDGHSFRDSIMAKPGEQSWLTSDVLVKTLQQFTGDMTDAELAAQGFNDEQIKAIQQTAKTAKHAATEVKTISQVFDVAKETIGSGWSQTFQNIFGDFEESKTTFTAMSEAINGFINTNADARNKVLGDWKELGGRTELIEGVKAAFEALMSVLKPIKDAFRDIFPPKTGQDLFNLTTKFRDLMENLKIGPETAENLKRTFRGFFAVLDIGWTIVKRIVGVIGDLLGAAKGGAGGFLEITGGIGDFLVALDSAISKGDALNGFFEGLENVLLAPIELVKAFSGVIGDLFESDVGDSGAKVSEALGNMGVNLEPLSNFMDKAANAGRGFLDVLAKLRDILQPIISDIGEVVRDFGNALANAFDNADFDKIFTIVQTGLIGGIFLAIKKALGGGVNLDLGGGLFEKLGKSLDIMNTKLTSMQRNVQAGTLLKIAAAIGILAVGILLLSTIKPDKLSTAMTAVAVGLGELVGALALLGRATGGAGFLTMPLIAGALILLAVAIDLLAIAVFAFSKLSWEELAKGLVGVGGALGAIAVGIKGIGPRILFVGPALIPLAIALNILAVAVKIFGEMKWEELAKGLLGVGLGLTAIGVGMKMIGPSLILTGPGLIAAAIGLTLLSGAVRSFGGMDLGTMAKGILGIAAALVAIGVAIEFIPPTVALQAVGLAILAVALMGIAGAIKLMGGMKVVTIVKGLAAIGGALVVLGLGLTAMSGTVMGTAALLGAAVALGILTPVLITMGNLEWSTIIKGLVAIAATMGTIAIVGAVAAPGLTAVGVALLALGAAMALISGSIYILAKGISLLSDEGVKGFAVMVTAITAFVAILPKIAIEFVKGLVGIVSEVAKVAPQLVEAIVKIVDQILDVIVKSAPKMAQATVKLILAMLKVINESAGPIIEAGFKLLQSLLSGISSHLPKVMRTAGDIVVKFLKGLADQAPRIVRQGTDTLVSFLNGITNNLSKVVTSVSTLVTKFLTEVTKHIPDVIAKGATLLVKFLNGIGNNLPKVITAAVDVVQKFLKGIGDNIDDIIHSGIRLVKKFIKGIGQGALELGVAAMDTLIKFMNGLADAIREKGPDLIDAGENIADAIIDGVVKGIAEGAWRVTKSLAGLPVKGLKALGGVLGIHSPSTVMADIGMNMMKGWAQGVDQHGGLLSKALMTTADKALFAAALRSDPKKLPDFEPTKKKKKKKKEVEETLEGIDSDPVITPVLDMTKIEEDIAKLNLLMQPGAADISGTLMMEAQRTARELSGLMHPTAPGAAGTDTAEGGMAGVTFNQYNSSPESLSEAQIYRNTQNQLAQIRINLGLAPAI